VAVKISVVTPSKNQGRFIEKTIRSVINQRFDGLQYIVVDGASTDNTLSILKPYEKYFDVFISEPDESHPHALVKAFRYAKGEILAYINSDDQYYPGVLSEVWEAFQQNPEVSLIYGDRVYIDENGKATGTWILPRHWDYFMIHSAHLPQETAFWRRSAYEAIGGIDPELFFAFDYDFFIRLMRHGKSLHRRRFHAAFRLHPESKTVRLYDSIGVQDVKKTQHKNRVENSATSRFVCRFMQEYIARRSARFSSSHRLQELSAQLRELDPQLPRRSG
jgi:glycosyltransferase involved in cell wall biosynthesis